MTRTKRVQFGWKDPRIGGDPAVVGPALKRIERLYGVLTAEVVVSEAREPASPLHRFFEWDDAVAAESYRQEQARGLLRAVVMTNPARPGEMVRAFLMVDTPEGGAYVNTIRAMSDDTMREQVLRRAKAELTAFRVKYADLKELAGVIAAIEEVA